MVEQIIGLVFNYSDACYNKYSGFKKWGYFDNNSTKNRPN